MAVVMSMTWTGVTREQYDQVMERLGLDESPPDGGMFHLAGPGDGAWRVVDVWESQEAFERFMGERLQAVVQEIGLQGQPDLEFFPLHNVWAPRGEEVLRLGASSQPA
jgi:hypothetical protein